MKNCSRCGAPAADETKFCTSCGNPFAVSAPPAPQPAEPVEPVEPAEPVEPVEPVEPTEPDFAADFEPESPQIEYESPYGWQQGAAPAAAAAAAPVSVAFGQANGAGPSAQYHQAPPYQAPPHQAPYYQAQPQQAPRYQAPPQQNGYAAPAYNYNQASAYSQPTTPNGTYAPASAPTFTDEYQLPSRYRLIHPWGYVGYTILFSIPVIGFILLIVFSLNREKLNRMYFARSYFCFLLLGILMSIVLAVVVMSMGGLDAFWEAFQEAMYSYY